MWRQGYIRAYQWYCGDEWCDCHQPVIERCGPNTDAGYPWLRITRLWEGTFHSEPNGDERKQMRLELASELRRRRRDNADPPETEG